MATTYVNPYATLAEFTRFKISRGLPVWAVDANDDAVIERILASASRYFDGQTGRKFYPYIEAKVYDAPRGTNDDRELWLDDDLQEVMTLTNGDATVIALKKTSDLIWEFDDDNNGEQVIEVDALWGYHNEYVMRAWKVGSTLNEAANLNATDLTFTVTSGTLFSAGQVIRVDDELMIVSNVATNDLTVLARGDNGSTAATHDDGTDVEIWQVMDDVKEAVLEIASNCHARRTGANTAGSGSVTAGGVFVGPSDVSEFARNVIKNMRRWV